ncbi:UNVERIFIED_ORG: phytoene dehydrogenase-like protein [Variovorax paradoxus]|nr:phytoene dehydrogenase-like protein [Variovorax paradoxus]
MPRLTASPVPQRISLADVARATGAALGRFDGAEVARALGRFEASYVGSEEHPTIADISECLFFSPGDGRIWLQDQRMVLLHTEALGSLRRELIDSLGQEKARGLFTRAATSAAHATRSWCARTGRRPSQPRPPWPAHACMPRRAW